MRLQNNFPINQKRKEPNSKLKRTKFSPLRKMFQTNPISATPQPVRAAQATPRTENVCIQSSLTSLVSSKAYPKSLVSLANPLGNPAMNK